MQITLDLLSQQIEVHPDAIEDVRQLYAPSDHEVFVLVPMDFATMIDKVYIHMGNPVIAVDTVWDVYLALHDTLISCGHCMVVMKCKMRMDTSILEVLMAVKVLLIHELNP